mmetsp:Transcript_18869/g.60113  ORF Transcript_18869/g.60113 Transcript_18869/m.60113 type:complete len:87 (-) Transcript_18869:189-449(-)
MQIGQTSSRRIRRSPSVLAKALTSSTCGRQSCGGEVGDGSNRDGSNRRDADRSTCLCVGVLCVGGEELRHPVDAVLPALLARVRRL